MNDHLANPFTPAEVRKAFFYLNPSKAPGPNGFTTLFFQDAWDIMGEEITRVVLGVLNGGDSLKDWNSTVVTLIPKTKDPSSLKDFRSISLCNVVYKIMARTITNRLKGILDRIIDPHQSAFIPGRAISNNIIIGFECMHWL